MLRIMATVCHISFEEFEKYKQTFINTSLASAHKIKSLCSSVHNSVLENYPENIFLKKDIVDDIFLSDEMEYFATSLFVELKMYISPEEVLCIYILI
jgi:hypothetical protein